MAEWRPREDWVREDRVSDPRYDRLSPRLREGDVGESTSDQSGSLIRGESMSIDLSSIQAALSERGLDGWLFYDFRGSDPLSYSILGLPSDVFQSRRWFYYVPADGEPTRIVHAIESGALDTLPGDKWVYLPWTQINELLRETVSGAKRIAMQYSPYNAIPYISRVDGGTLELIRSMGPEVVSSADLVQLFEATLTDWQYASHVYAADMIAHICQEAFDEIGRLIKAGSPATEFQIQQFICRRFEEEGLVTDHPPIVAVDAHAADPHFAPSSLHSATIGADQSVLIDLWAKRQDSGAIYADITKVAYTGADIPKDYLKVFKIVRDARDAAVAFIRAKIAAGETLTGADVDDACRAVIVKAGYGEYFIHRTGHSIHQSTHGNGANIDNLETRDGRSLIPRTLFSIEPGIYLPDRFGIRSEINVYLTGEEAVVTGPPCQTEVHRIPV